MIEQKKEDGWEFLFLGANIDAIGEAEKIGIAADRSVTYLADDIGNQVAYEAIADATYEMRCAPDMASVTGGWKTSIEKDVAKRGGKKQIEPHVPQIAGEHGNCCILAVLSSLAILSVPTYRVRPVAVANIIDKFACANPDRYGIGFVCA